MFRTQDFLIDLPVFRADRSFQRLVEILLVIFGNGVLYGAVFLDQNSFTLAVFQIDRRHDAVSGFEDSGQLHVPKGQGMFLTYALIHILQGQDCVVLCTVALTKICDDGHVTIFMVFFSAPLTEHIRFLHGSLLDPAQVFQREFLAEPVPVSRMDLLCKAGVQKLVPWKRP